MDTWNRLTAVRGEGEGGTGWKKVKGSPEDINACSMDTDTSVGEGRGARGWVEVGKGEENGGICNSVNNKNKV